MRHGDTREPYILVSRGEDFVDPFDPPFLAKTFPTLFPMGRGGSRQAEESLPDVAGEVDGGVEAEARARSLVSSRNMTLETWAKVVLQRHGSRFATHHVFAFLVFNMGSEVEKSSRQHAQHDEEELPGGGAHRRLAERGEVGGG